MSTACLLLCVRMRYEHNACRLFNEMQTEDLTLSLSMSVKLGGENVAAAAFQFSNQESSPDAFGNIIIFEKMCHL